MLLAVVTILPHVPVPQSPTGWHSLLPITSIIPGPHGALGRIGSHHPPAVLAHPARHAGGGPIAVQPQSGGPLIPGPPPAATHSCTPTRLHVQSGGALIPDTPSIS